MRVDSQNHNSNKIYEKLITHRVLQATRSHLHYIIPFWRKTLSIFHDTMGCTDRRRNDDDDDDDSIEDEVFVVSVDRRGRAASDLEAYKEYTCPRSFFEEKIVDYPNTVCVVSEIAELCGLDLKMYFFESDHHRDQYIHRGHQHHNNTIDDKTNIAASLMTFNPDTGHTRFKIHGKAYLVWDDGKKPLSKRQVWGIHELVKEARILYHDAIERSSYSDYTVLRRVKLEILGWCAQYEAGTWSPHAIYEPRHPHHPHHHIHHKSNHQIKQKSKYNRGVSGVSDSATCHHGEDHMHTDCCHKDHDHHRQHLSNENDWDEAINRERVAVDPFGLKLKEKSPRSRNPLQAVFSACHA